MAAVHISRCQDPVARLIWKEVRDLLCCEGIVRRIDIVFRQNLVDLVAIGANQACKLEDASGTGHGRQFADVVQSVAIDIDEHGETGKTRLVRVLDAIAVKVTEFHTGNLRFDDRVPLVERTIVGRSGPELREERHVRIAGRPRGVEHRHRKVEDVILLALTCAQIVQD